MGFSFFLGVTLFAGAVLFYVLQPLLSGKQAPMGGSDAEMTDAEQKRRVTLLALRDVEYDRVTGKLDEHDYNELKREISAEALAAIAAEQAEAGSAPGTQRGDVIDFEAELRRVRSGLRAGTTCRSCGHVNPSGSRFCSSCGSSLTVRAPAGAGKGG